jgi:hypothetical protein
LSRIDRGTDAKVERTRTRASTDSPRTGYIRRLRAGASGRNIAFLATIFALCGTAVAIAAPGGTAVGDNPANPGNPGLAQHGAVANNGFPAWYRDRNGTRLEPCLDAANPLCIMGALPNGDAAVTPSDVTGNFPDEFFYQAAGAGLDNVGANIGTAAKPRFGKASLDASLEGAFLNGPPKQSEQMVFARLRLRITGGLLGSTNYLFVHPYGERTIQTDTGSDNLFVTEDIGVTPGKFDDALNGRIAPFLKWDPAVAPTAPDGYTGDPNIDHPVTGGVNDYFAVIGPGVGANRLADGTQDCPAAVLAKAGGAPGGAINGTSGDDGKQVGLNDCLYTNLFSLMGKLAQNAGVDVKTTTFSRDSGGNTTVDVQAESDGNQTIVVQDPGSSRNEASRLFPTTKLVEDRGNYYGHVSMDSTKGFPNGSEHEVQILNATDGDPQDSKTVSPVDEILDATATFDTTPDGSGKGKLTIAAKSSDQFPDDNVKLSVNDPMTGAPADLDGSGQATLALASAPRSVTITSSKGGTLVVPVHTDVAAPATPAPLAANAGRPAKAQTGQSVKLFGTGSTGPIAGYAWTGPFAVNPDGTVDTGTPNDANGGGIGNGTETTDTAQLTAPNAAGQYGYQLEVTGDDGATDKATTVLTVGDGGPVAGVLGDPLTPGKTRYTESQGRLVIDGTATVTTNNKVLIWFTNHVPADLTTQPDATAVVDPVGGGWVYDTGRGGMPNPPNADCVSYISTHGDPNVVGDLNALGTPADEWNCVPIDGRQLTAPLPPAPAPAGAAAAGPQAAAAGAPRAIAGAVPGPAGVGLARVAAPATVTAAALATTGVPVNVTVPAGATLLRVRVLTTANQPLATTFQKVKGGKKVKVTVRSAKAARKLRAGKRFVLEVRAGTAKNRLGKATRTVIRVR